jgi:hypothetical protein
MDFPAPMQVPPGEQGRAGGSAEGIVVVTRHPQPQGRGAAPPYGLHQPQRRGRPGPYDEGRGPAGDRRSHRRDEGVRGRQFHRHVGAIAPCLDDMTRRLHPVERMKLRQAHLSWHRREALRSKVSLPAYRPASLSANNATLLTMICAGFQCRIAAKFGSPSSQPAPRCQPCPCRKLAVEARASVEL